jgi:nucleoporin POM152
MTVSATPYSFLPDTHFDSIGQYSYVLTSLVDANGCTQPIMNEFVDVDVAPEPSCSFVVSQAHACVGDVIELSLQGTPPWKVEYTFTGTNGTIATKTLDVVAEKGLFTQHDGVVSRRVHMKFGHAGVLSVNRICHGGKKSGKGWCCKDLSDMRMTVYGLPSAVINQGSNGMDIIREGNEATMVIGFKGHPPFAFTYVRQSDSGSDLDAHTVSDIAGYTYEARVNQAGTFKITAISDRFCHYPRSRK